MYYNNRRFKETISQMFESTSCKLVRIRGVGKSTYQKEI